MPSRTLPGIGLNGFWDLGEDGWKDGMDANLRLLSALVQPRALDRVAAVPGSPTNGQIYILTDAPNANAIAIRDNGAWVYVTPAEGWTCYDVAADAMLIFDGTAWVELTTAGGGGGGGGVIVAASTSSITIGTGSRTFTYASIPGLGWVVGSRLRAANTSTNWVEGVVTAVSDTSVTINVDLTSGTGTFAAWNIALAGERGTAGAAGAAGSSYPAFGYSARTSSYVAVTADFSGNRAIGMNLAGGNTLTINSGLAPVEPLTVVQVGVGQTTIVAGAGVTIHSSIGLRLRARYSTATLIPIGTDTYVLSGDIAA